MLVPSKSVIQEYVLARYKRVGDKVIIRDVGDSFPLSSTTAFAMNADMKRRGELWEWLPAKEVKYDKD